jgi:rubrerythrin
MNIELLRKEFHEILTLEERAEHFYSHYIDQVDDKKIKETLSSIRDDEKMHIEIAKQLIELVL